MTVTEARLPDLLIALHDQYGAAFPKPSGMVVKFHVIHENATYPQAKSEIEALLTLHGVVVSEIASEMRMASDSVRVNSRNSRPRMPPISRMGRKTAIKDRLIDRTVKPTSRAPIKAARSRGIPASR